MKRIALPLVAMAAAAAPAAAADVSVAAQGPVVELSVTETVKANPNQAEIGAGVTTEAPTAVEAMRINAERMTKVIAEIRARGVAVDDIQTTGINLNANYDYNNGRAEFRGYQASNRVSVLLSKIDQVGVVLDALVAAGATDLSGPSFSVANDTDAQAQARKAAVMKAERMAREYAEWNGYTGVRVLKIAEGVQSGPPMPMMRDAIVLTAQAASTPVQPGMVGTSVTVAITYEMTR